MSQLEISARMTVRPGKLEGFKRQAAEVMRLVKENDTGTLRWDWFLSKDGTKCEVREAYVDSDAFMQHRIHIAEALQTLFKEFATDHAVSVYGEPSHQLVERVTAMGQSVSVTWYSFLQGLEPAKVPAGAGRG